MSNKSWHVLAVIRFMTHGKFEEELYLHLIILVGQSGRKVAIKWWFRNQNRKYFCEIFHCVTKANKGKRKLQITWGFSTTVEEIESFLSGDRCHQFQWFFETISVKIKAAINHWKLTVIVIHILILSAISKDNISPINLNFDRILY